MASVLETALIVISILLIAIVLFQSNKATDGGAQIISGGNAMLLGNMKERGSEKFITRTTYVLAVLFIVISAVLNFI